MHGDEAVHAWLAWNFYSGAGYQYDPVYHGPLQFPVTALFYFLFGPSNTSGRLMSILFGAALIGTPYYLRQYMGRAAALVAAALIAVSPAFVYVSRLERDDMFTVLFALTMAIGIFGYAQTQKPRFLYLIGASAALSLAAMENTYITYFIFGSFLGIVLLTEYIAGTQLGQSLVRFWSHSGSAHFIRWSFLGGALGVLLAAFLLTVATGLHPPVPIVLVLLVVALVHRQTLMESVGSEGGAYLRTLRGTSKQAWVNTLTIVLAILFITYSTFGTNLRGIWDASEPFLNTSSACRTSGFLFNPCRKDIIGGLFYWLSQHPVARGGQPWYYYSLLFGLYEQLALVFGVGGIIWFWRRPTLFTMFLTYWAIWAFGIYSWAGEKFPWLIVHSLLPFTLLAAMFVVDLVRAGGRVRYVTVAVVSLLGLLELHSMYEVNFVNGANPVEMMVYVQSAPDTPRVAQQILALSNKVTNGPDLHVTIDSEDTWPFAWYLRDMRNVAYPTASQVAQKPYSTNPVIIVDDAHEPSLHAGLTKSYTGHRYRLRWWFPEEGYKALTWSSALNHVLDPGYWRVVEEWLLQRRPFGDRQAVYFYYYVKNGLASPF